MFCMDSGVHRTNGSCIEIYKSISIHYGQLAKFFLKYILMCLYCTKYNKISRSHSDLPYNVSDEKYYIHATGYLLLLDQEEMQKPKRYLLNKYIILEITIDLIFKKFGCIGSEKSVPSTTTSSSNNSCYMSDQ